MMIRRTIGVATAIFLVTQACWVHSGSWKDARIDHSREQEIRKICDFVIGHTRNRRYHPPMARHPESVYYRATIAATLSLAGKLLQEKGYSEAASTMFDQVVEERLNSMWPVSMWADFPIFDRPFPLDWEEQEAHPHPRTTGLVLYSLGLHHQISGEDRFLEPARQGLKDLFATWNFNHDKERMLHFTAEAAALAVTGWEHALPQFGQMKKPIVDWVLETFVETAPKDYAYFAALRMQLILAATGTEHLRTVVRPGWDAFLAEPRWRYWHNPDDFRHTNDAEINVRGNGAVAYALRLHDLAAGEKVYTTTPLYQHLSTWMDSMRRPDGGCHSFQSIANGKPYALGTLAHTLQLWWLLGGFLY